jgi:hypothetical protein
MAALPGFLAQPQFSGGSLIQMELPKRNILHDFRPLFQETRAK